MHQKQKNLVLFVPLRALIIFPIAVKLWAEMSEVGHRGLFSTPKTFLKNLCFHNFFAQNKNTRTDILVAYFAAWLKENK